MEERVKRPLGNIVDTEGRSFGPLSLLIKYYWYHAKMLSTDNSASVEEEENSININHLRLLTLALLVVTEQNRGPFFVTHPDFAGSKMLFDCEFNSTALLHWNGAQTSPIESFSHL